MNDHDDSERTIERRDLLKLGASAGLGLLAQGALAKGRPTLAALPHNPVTPDAMPMRNLGRTGYRVGIFSLGGQAAVEQPNNERIAVPIVERAIELGVNYIDTSARYGGEERWSERYIGSVLKHSKQRKRVFLATKSHDRTRDGSLKLLEKSLELLHTDHVDLWQLHNLARMEQIEQIFAPGGAVEALQLAREQKIVRAVGISGHADPDVLVEAIRRFPFDTVLMALNAADRYRLPFAEKLLPLAVEKEMGIIGMKIPARGRILAGWTPPPPDPKRPEQAALRTGTLSMKDAMRYVLSLPVSTVIIGCDSVAQLEENVAIARSFTPLSATQMAALADVAEPVARQSLFFRRWT